MRRFLTGSLIALALGVVLALAIMVTTRTLFDRAMRHGPAEIAADCRGCKVCQPGIVDDAPTGQEPQPSDCKCGDCWCGYDFKKGTR